MIFARLISQDLHAVSWTLAEHIEMVEFRELLMANTIYIDTIYQLLIQKGFFTKAEFLENKYKFNCRFIVKTNKIKEIIDERLRP